MAGRIGTRLMLYTRGLQWGCKGEKKKKKKEPGKMGWLRE